MNKDLLFKVSTENLNLMHEALCKIIADMQNAEPDKAIRCNNEIFVGCLMFSRIILDILNQRINKMGD